MYGVFIVGTAGSGKSLMTASLHRWLAKKGGDVAAVNLDPGAVWLPYNPDIDVRNYVSIDELMEKYELGPNGALVMAADLAADREPEINKEISELNPDWVLIDTPGQMELFAFRVSGPLLARQLSLDNKMVLYLFDAPFCSFPFNYVSSMFLSAAVSIRFMLPQLNVLSKSDLVSKEKLKEILSWSSRQGNLRSAFNLIPEANVYLLGRDIFDAVERLRLDFSLIACSAKNFGNFVDLHAALLRVFTRGEEESESQD